MSVMKCFKSFKDRLKKRGERKKANVNRKPCNPTNTIAEVKQALGQKKKKSEAMAGRTTRSVPPSLAG